MKEDLKDQLSKLDIVNNNNVPVTGKKNRRFQLVQEENIERGSVIYLPLSGSDGLVLANGYRTRNKFVVIIGVMDEEYIVGALLINSSSGKFTNEKLRNCQYPMRKESYASFLDYTSWLDCSMLFQIPKHKILLGEYCGKLTSEDLMLVMECLRRTDTISINVKKAFRISDI
ncbi:MAG: hypothetical protein LBN06_02185 [Prevotellaceae bacterium]|jgi:hypothetical protein|nr:hypothetical protein [Prevotellaceae bacterium]